MKTDFILFNNTFIIKGLSNRKRLIYILKVIIPFSLVAFLFYGQFVNPLILLIVVIPVVSTLREFFKFPPVFFDIVITKMTEYIIINRKKINYSDLLFLSMKEHENYGIIRLEAKRKNILIANEKILIDNANGFEQALSLSRQLRDFISPDLKINYMTMGNSGPNEFDIYAIDNRGGGKSSDIEIWHLID